MKTKKLITVIATVFAIISTSTAQILIWDGIIKTSWYDETVTEFITKSAKDNKMQDI
jgi:hypothetical protein